MPDYLDLEKLVAKIQGELAPNAEVLHNQRIEGRYSKRPRQIDVLVRDMVGQYEITIVIDCKDYKKPADVKSVEEFSGLVGDVGAQKGVLVCPSGFSQAAKTRAEGLQVELYSPIDTGVHKWTVNPMVPAVVDFRSAAMRVGLQCSSPLPFTMPQDFQYTKQITDAGGVGRGSLFATAIEKWNYGELPVEPGRHEDLSIFDGETFMENGYGAIIPVTPLLTISVTKQLYFGQLPITRISGFRDEVRGGVITNGFEVGIVSIDEVTENWKQVECIEDCEQPPGFIVQGLLGWDDYEPNDKSVSLWNDPAEFEDLFFGARPPLPSFEEVMGRPISPIDAILGSIG